MPPVFFSPHVRDDLLYTGYMRALWGAAVAPCGELLSWERRKSFRLAAPFWSHKEVTRLAKVQLALKYFQNLATSVL